MMGPADQIKIIGVCLVFGGFLLNQAIRRHRRIRHVSDTPRSKTASAPEGFVELEGFAWPDSETVPSRGGTEALYYSFELQREVTQGTGKHRRRKWVTVFRRLHALPFYLVDGTGVVMLDPEIAELSLESTTTRSWRSIETGDKKRITEIIVTSPVAEFPPQDSFFGLFGPRFRVVENEILAGSPVYASGDFKSTGEHPFHIQSLGLGYFWSRAFDAKTGVVKNLKKILDTNDDGRIDANEAKRGYSVLAQIARSKAKPQTRPHDAGAGAGAAATESCSENKFELHGTLSTSPTHKLFIADTNQVHLTERLGRFLWTQFFGGALLITAGIALTLGLLRNHNPQQNATQQRIPSSVPKTLPPNK